MVAVALDILVWSVSHAFVFLLLEFVDNFFSLFLSFSSVLSLIIFLFHFLSFDRSLFLFSSCFMFQPSKRVVKTRGLALESPEDGIQFFILFLLIALLWRLFGLLIG